MNQLPRWAPPVLVAAIYFGCAVGSRLLALPSSFASPVWPAAGVAVAALWFGGVRLWPAIWIGAWVSNFRLGPEGFAWAALGVPTLIATGATAQALLAERLTRRLVAAPDPLSRERDVLLLLLLAGPVACVVSATVGIGSLIGFGGVTAAASVQHWLGWWTGDTIGVLLLAPLAFRLMPHVHASGGLKLTQVAVPLLLTGLLVVIALLWRDLGSWGAATTTPLAPSPRLLLLAVLTVFLCAHIVLASAGRSAAIAREVAARTAALERELAARRATEEALRESETRHRLLLTNSRDAIMTLAPPQWRFTAGNPATVELFGARDEAEFTSLGPWQVSPEYQSDGQTSAAKAPQMIERAMRDGVHFFEWTHCRVNGPTFPATVLLTRMEIGGQVFLQATVRDITAQKKAEASLQDMNAWLEAEVRRRTAELANSEDLLSETGRAACIGGWRLDLPERRVHWTAETFRIHDLPAGHQPTYEEAIAYYPPGARATLERAIGDAIERGEAWDLDVPFRSATGRELLVRIAGRAVTENGVVVRLHGAIQDITQRVAMERQVNHAQRLEAIGTLAGGIAHDLNNALAPILMTMSQLREACPAEAEAIGLIETSARRATGMVRQLLAFGKGVEGQRAPLRPAQLIEEIAALVRGTFPKNIDFTALVPPELPPLDGDATQLHQVLLNLCVNARDALPRGGRLALAASVETVDAAPADAVLEARRGRYVVFSVSDTGVGIAPEVLPRIFEPFFTTKGPEKGSGLGLATVLGIVKSHGGFLRVESQPGRGTTFRVYLPTEHGRAARVAHAPAASHAARGRGELVLFVDDEPMVRTVAQRVLAHLGYTPLIATHGAEAVSLAAANRAGLRALITDLHMPQMDGVALIRALRPTWPALPIIVASGRLDDSIVAELNALGVTHRLDKPFSQEQLAEVLHGALESPGAPQRR